MPLRQNSLPLIWHRIAPGEYISNVVIDVGEYEIIRSADSGGHPLWKIQHAPAGHFIPKPLGNSRRGDSAATYREAKLICDEHAQRIAARRRSRSVA